VILVCFAATNVAGFGLGIRATSATTAVLFLRWIGGALGSRGFLVLLGFESVFVAELPSGLTFGLLSDPGLRPGFFRPCGCASPPKGFTESVETWALRCSLASCCAAGEPGSESECGGDESSGDELERGVAVFGPSTPAIL
jgi:hypothetical protein